MILLTRLDNREFWVNAEYIQSVESRPDTHLVLINGHSYIVREPDREVVARILEYRRQAYGPGTIGAQHYLRVIEE